MSSDNVAATSPDLENKNQVVISVEDAQECAKFFQFFEIPVPEPLKVAFENFQKAPTFQHQDELRFELSEIISHSTHPVFQDEVFTQVRPECSEINEGLNFERRLEKELTPTVTENESHD